MVGFIVSYPVVMPIRLWQSCTLGITNHLEREEMRELLYSFMNLIDTKMPRKSVDCRNCFISEAS